MLIDWWEKVRGYDKWIEANAIVKSSTLDERVVGHDRAGRDYYGWFGDEWLTWKDYAGAEQCEPITVSESSPVFQSLEGNSLVIRYNPTNPTEFYIRDQLQYQLSRAAKIICWVAASLSAVVAWSFVMLRN